MKKTVFKRAAAFVLAFGMILQLSGCTSQDKEPMKIMFHPSTAEFEAALFTNPDRGFRLESYTDLSLHSTENNKYNITQWNDKFQAAAEKVKEGIWAKPKLTQVYCYLTEYRDTETLPDIVFQNLDAIFQALKQEKMKGVIRFAYQGSMEAKNEQASQEIMLAHMEQLAPVLEKYKDLIHTVEAGFMGAWGEWHSYPGHTWDDPGQISNEYFDGAVILRGILDMVPDDIYVQVRYPGIGELIDKEDPDHMRLGLNNDAFFGFRNQAGAWPYEEMGNSHCHIILTQNHCTHRLDVFIAESQRQITNLQKFMLCIQSHRAGAAHTIKYQPVTICYGSDRLLHRFLFQHLLRITQSNLAAAEHLVHNLLHRIPRLRHLMNLKGRIAHILRNAEFHCLETTIPQLLRQTYERCFTYLTALCGFSNGHVGNSPAVLHNKITQPPFRRVHGGILTIDSHSIVDVFPGHFIHHLSLLVYRFSHRFQ